MNRERITAIGVFVCGLLLFVTGDLMWLPVMCLVAVYYGWNLGKRIIPTEGA